jgi:acyl carrier protein
MTDEVLVRVKRIVAEDLDLDLKFEQIDETIPLFEEGLALDSVILVELISLIEKRFGIELRDEALNMETFRNLESVAAVVRQQLAAQKPSA